MEGVLRALNVVTETLNCYSYHVDNIYLKKRFLFFRFLFFFFFFFVLVCLFVCFVLFLLHLKFSELMNEKKSAKMTSFKNITNLFVLFCQKFELSTEVKKQTNKPFLNIVSFKVFFFRCLSEKNEANM